MIAKNLDQDQPKPSDEPKSAKTSGPSLFDLINKKEPEEDDKDDKKPKDKDDKKKLPKKPEDKKPNPIEDIPSDKASRPPHIADMLNRI